MMRDDRVAGVIGWHRAEQMAGPGERRRGILERPGAIEEMHLDALSLESGPFRLAAACPGDGPTPPAQALRQRERAVAKAEAEEAPVHSAPSSAVSRRSATVDWRSRAHSQ